MDRFYSLTHSPIDFYFRQSARDFVVDEIPLYEFSGVGEHIILHVRKKNLATWDMLKIFAKYLGIADKEIGYAGLKDKNAQTKQYISIHKKHEEKLETFEHDSIKIISTMRHVNKIKLGHLQGNRFFIRLKKVNPTSAKKLKQAFKEIKEHGMPNFFGYQRFGMYGDNYKLGEEILLGKRKEKNRKLKKMYINAYQSHLFNLWLSRRLEISTLVDKFEPSELCELLNFSEEFLVKLKAQPQKLKLLRGDLMLHYPHGKLFTFDEEMDVERFKNRDISLTGLLCGTRVKTSEDIAYSVEKEFSADIAIDGARRYAWVFPTDMEIEYKEDKAWCEMHFTLPKGSYATVLIEELAKRDIKNEQYNNNDEEEDDDNE